MILNNNEALARLNSSENLINRLANASKGISVNGSNSITSPTSLSLPARSKTSAGVITAPPVDLDIIPTLDNLIPDVDDKVKIATAKAKAVKLMGDAIDELAIRLPEIKADKLPSVISAASKMVTDITREQNEERQKRKESNLHLHFYTPEQKQLSDYDFIEVG